MIKYTFILGIAIFCITIIIMTRLILNQATQAFKINRFSKNEILKQTEQTTNIIHEAELKALDNNNAWDGKRKFELKRVQENNDVCSFHLYPHDKKPLPPFRPGQYLTFYLNLPGASETSSVRCYSLSDAPIHNDHYRVSIKKQLPPRDESKANIGLSSSHFFHSFKGDEILDVLAPAGEFYLDTLNTDSPVVLIGGGIGLTPMISMLNYICKNNKNRETWFFYGVNNSNDHVWKEHLNSLRKLKNIHIVICYSQPLETDQKVTQKNQNTDYDEQAWVSVDLFKKLLPSNNFDYYLCGPPPMMKSVVDGLCQWDVPASKIHFEAFGPTTVKNCDDQDIECPAEGFEVTFSGAIGQGKKIIWKGEHKNLLEFAEANNLIIPNQCRIGKDRVCELALRTGDVKNISPPCKGVKDGSFLPCISVPKGPITIEF